MIERPQWSRLLTRSPTKPAVLFRDDEIDSLLFSRSAGFQRDNLGPLPPTDDTLLHYRTKNMPGRRPQERRAMAGTAQKARLQGKAPACQAQREDTNAALRAGTPG